MTKLPIDGQLVDFYEKKDIMDMLAINDRTLAYLIKRKKIIPPLRIVPTVMYWKVETWNEFLASKQEV